MVEIPFSFNRIETFRILTIGYLFYLPFLWYSNQITLFSTDPLFHTLFGLILSLLLFPLLYIPTTLIQTYLERIQYWKPFKKVICEKLGSNPPEWKDVQEKYKRAAIIWSSLDMPEEIRERIKNYKNISTLLFNLGFISIAHICLSYSAPNFPYYLLPILFSMVCYTSLGGGIYFHSLCLFSEISMWEQEILPKKQESLEKTENKTLSGIKAIKNYEKKIELLYECPTQGPIKPLQNKYFYIFLGSTGIMIISLFLSWLLTTYYNLDNLLVFQITIWVLLSINVIFITINVIKSFLTE